MRNILKPRDHHSDTNAHIPLINRKLFGYRVTLRGWHWTGSFPLGFQCTRFPASIFVSVPIGRYFEVDLIIRKEKDYA